MHPTTITFTFSGFWKSHFFSENSYTLPKKKPNFEHFENFCSFSRNVQRVCYLYQFFFKKSFCSKWTRLFFSKPQIFELFEASYLLSCIVVQVCYIQRFLKKVHKFFEKPFYFFRKNHKLFEKTICFLIKKPNFVTLREILLIQLRSTANLLPLAVFKQLKIFFEKPIFFQK